jgi:hypothetical protein
MCQFISDENPVYCPDRWHWLNSQIFHFPQDRLGTTEQLLAIEIGTNHLDDLLYL